MQPLEKWLDLMKRLSSDSVAYLCHVYLGTPLSSIHGKILNDLGRFFLSEEVSSRIIDLIDDEEAAILTAIILGAKTPSEFAYLMGESENPIKTALLLMNLKERLLIFWDEKDGQFCLSPLLSDRLKKKVISLNCLFNLNDGVTDGSDILFTESFLNALVVYFIGERRTFKGDARRLIKKRDEKFDRIFTGKDGEEIWEWALKILSASCLLVEDAEHGAYLNRSQLKKWLTLGNDHRLYFIWSVVADVAIEDMKRLILNFPKKASLSEDDAFRLTSFLCNSDDPQGVLFRLKKINLLYERDGQWNLRPDIDDCITRRNTPLIASHNLEVFVPPDVRISTLEFLSCCDLVRYDTFSRYSIDPIRFKLACTTGFSAEKAVRTLERGGAECPINLKSRFVLWEEESSRFKLFRGLILLVPERESDVIASSPEVEKFILEIPRKGIFMINDNKQGWRKALSDAGVEVPPIPNTDETVPFEVLTLNKGELRTPSSISERNTFYPREETKEHWMLLRKGEVYDDFRAKKLIVAEKQNNYEFRIEKMKARGMDFSAKKNLVGLSINDKRSFLEISLFNENDDTETFLFFPQSLENCDGEFHVKGRILPFGEKTEIPLRRVTRVNKHLLSLISEDIQFFLKETG